MTTKSKYIVIIFILKRGVSKKEKGEQKHTYPATKIIKSFFYSAGARQYYDTNASVHLVRQLNRHAGFKTFNTAKS